MSQYQFKIDGTTAKTGTHSLYFVQNDTGWNNRVFLYQDKSAAANSRFTANKQYQVSFWYKSDSLSNMYISLGNKTIQDSNIWNMYPQTNWTKKTFNFSGSMTPTSFVIITLILKFISSPGGIWIDEVETYELDQNNNPIGANLISDYSF